MGFGWWILTPSGWLACRWLDSRRKRDGSLRIWAYIIVPEVSIAISLSIRLLNYGVP
jgi:hypothetical protein